MQETPQQSDISKKNPNVLRKARSKVRNRWHATKFFRRLERTYPYKFVVNLKNDNFFWSRFNGAVNGATLIGEAWLGFHFIHKHHKHLRRLFKFTHVAALPAAPLMGHVLGIAGCCALAVTGLCAVGYGLANAWKSMEGICARTFPEFNPPRKARVHVQKTAKGISAIPPMRKLSHGTEKVAGKVAQKPLAQKFLKSRLGRLGSKGPTQNQQDVFLAAVTIEGSATWMIGLPAAILTHVAALPAIATVGGMLAVAGVAAFALYEVIDCALSITSSTKTLTQIHRAHKSSKESAAHAVSIAPPAQEAGLRSVPASTAPVFNQAVAGTEAPSDVPAPARPRKPGLGPSS